MAQQYPRKHSFAVVRREMIAQFSSLRQMKVYCALASFSDADGKCWPSIDTLADITRIDRRDVQRTVRDLARHGFVRVVSGNGRHRPNTYVIAEKGGQNAHGFETEKGGQNAHGFETEKGGQNDTKRAGVLTPKGRVKHPPELTNNTPEKKPLSREREEITEISEAYGVTTAIAASVASDLTAEQCCGVCDIARDDDVAHANFPLRYAVTAVKNGRRSKKHSSATDRYRESIGLPREKSPTQRYLESLVARESATEALES